MMIWKDVEDIGRGLLSWHLSGETEKKFAKILSQNSPSRAEI
jgi:hypothetical protein